MRLHIVAVGRLRKGPERELVDDYVARIGKTGRALGLGPAQVIEVDDRKGGGMAAQAVGLEKAVPSGALTCVMDERGRPMSSPDFASQLGQWRDTGRADVAFVIGGADGLDPAFRNRADFAISFGQMVWPHMLVRVMLAEQLYRAASILAGTPYHRI